VNEYSVIFYLAYATVSVQINSPKKVVTLGDRDDLATAANEIVRKWYGWTPLLHAQDIEIDTVFEAPEKESE